MVLLASDRLFLLSNYRRVFTPTLGLEEMDWILSIDDLVLFTGNYYWGGLAVGFGGTLFWVSIVSLSTDLL